MSWLRDFLLGLLTRHLGAKILALLLSVGLFGFVQAQLTGTMEVPRLELRFTLADELKGGNVLVVDKMTFLGLTLTGQRSKVEPLSKANSLTLTIDDRVLRSYGRDHADGKVIAIDAKLFRDDLLFGKDVTVGGLPEGSQVVVNTFATRRAPIDVVPALRDLTHTDYEGRLTFTLNMKAVTLTGPKSAFLSTDATTILVEIPDVARRISAYQIQGDTGTIKLQGAAVVKWADSGIKPELLPLVRVAPEEPGVEPMKATDFAQRIVASCQVVKRKEVVTLPAVPIEIRYGVPPNRNLLADYNVFSVFTDANLSEGQMRGLEVKMPAVLAANEDFLANLVIVLDVSRAKEEFNRLKVPFYLDIRDKSRDDDQAALLQVDLTLADAVAEFGRKQ